MERPISPPPKRRKLSPSDTEQEESDPNVLTIYSWNVNGIQPLIQQPITSFFSPKDSHQKGNDTSLRGFLRRHDWPTFLFLQEVKVSPDDLTSVRALEKAVRRDKKTGNAEPDYVAHVNLPSDKFNARGYGRKLYGVCSIIRQDFADRWVERVRPVEWDFEGRFLVTELKAASNAQRIALINAYMVNGTDYPYKDPESGKVTGTRHDRKLEVHKLLAAECRKLEADGFAVILAGDINIAVAPIDGFPNLRTFPQQHCVNRADFKRRFLEDESSSSSSSRASEQALGKQSGAPEPDKTSQEPHGLGMVDTFRHLHHDTSGYTYYPRGRSFGESCDRVDMILTSKSLRDSLMSAGMHETSAERGTSDHVPLYAKLRYSEGVEEAKETVTS
ncbi:DNase I-like protein [Hortaea werneckii]|nr:DNase I-like protein [Hortaea werneckii]KAI7089571.1 DNase I-like protein [Hortaea werneckii]KAI7227640.1 DNase I-like protein [Hortaea werneckii]KAI7312570.1 DNase I-like protein [Hortaea werneckii]KAI7390278.1 DNase I-like protein [Hortaea werneckii]